MDRFSEIIWLLQPPYDISTPTLAKIRQEVGELCTYLETRDYTGFSKKDTPFIDDIDETYKALFKFFEYLTEINFASNYIEIIDDYLDRLHIRYTSLHIMIDPEIQRILRELQAITA